MSDSNKTLAPGTGAVASKRWLREASMKRLNMLIKNKKESIGEEFLCADISADDLESSGLASADRYHLNKWADGFESGRHCMLALLDNRAAIESDLMKSQSGKGVAVGAPQQRPLEMAMLSATISLPDEFLCDSGYLYESIFSRAPGAVVREAMQLLAAKAFEKTSSSLRVDQINLALKQLRVEKMTANVPAAGKDRDDRRKKSVTKDDLEVDSDLYDKNKENHSNGSSGSTSRTSPASTATDTGLSDLKKEKVTASGTGAGAGAGLLVIDREIELFRLQIVTELIKMHITAGRKLSIAAAASVSAAAAASTAAAAGSTALASDITSSSTASSSSQSAPPSSEGCDGSVKSLRRGSHTSSTLDKKEGKKDSEKTVDSDKDKEKDKEKGNEKRGSMDVDTIEQHLDSSLQAVEAIAEAQDPLELEESNIRLKPYLKQLNALKASLSTQLRELEDSRAFIALGISKEASEAMIKKAYHSKAIKLHPDKPGGDTAKFQQLQASYQEILKKKAEAAATEREINGDCHDDEDNEAEGAEERVKRKGQADEEKDRVDSVLHGLGEVLEQVKEAADQCARIGQLAIKWQKRVDRASRMPFPEDLNALYKIVKDTEAKKRKGDKDREKDREKDKDREGEDHYVLECSAKLAIAPLEKICELMQLLSSYAMELPSCGFRYGLAIAGNSNYMKVVESAMSSGLDAIKSVGALLSAEQQLNSCLNRMKEAKKYIFDFEKGDKEAKENESKKEVRTILVQMVLSAFRGNSATVGIAAERAVSALFIASELHGIASSVVQQTGEDRKCEAKKSAARKEEEREMCHEDREFLKEKKAQERDEDTKRFLAEEKRREDERKKEKEEEGSDSLEKLRLKIKSLQVQLRVQNVQTLQTLNGETKTLQRNLQLQLKELMALTLQDGEIFPPTFSSTSPSTSSSSSSSSSSSFPYSSSSSGKMSSSEKSVGGGVGVGGATGISGSLPLPPFRVSLLSLLADFIDSSCNELRADLQDIGTAHAQQLTQGTGQGVGQGRGLSCSGKARTNSGSPIVMSDTDSDESYEMVSALHIDGQDVEVTYTDVPSDPEGDTAARGSRITASIETHLGWMRDLRGEKPPTRYPTPIPAEPTVPTGSTGSSDPDPLDGPLKANSEGSVQEDGEADGIDESSPRHGDDSVQPEDAGQGRREEAAAAAAEGERAEEIRPSSPSSSQNDTSIPFVPLDQEPELVEVEKEEEEKEEKKGEEEGVDAANTEKEIKDEKGSSREERYEEVKQDFSVPGGVRLALLPDFRSKILWLAALVDVDGVVVIVREELHSRLKEIIDTASSLSCSAMKVSPCSFLSPPLPSPPSSPSAEGFCDSFCSLVVRGIRSAAAPLSDAK